MQFGWTEQQIDRLKQFHTEGLTARAIAARMGVSRNAVLGKLHRLSGPVPQGKQYGWTPEKDEALTALWREGKATKQIAFALDRSVSVISERVRTLGLRAKYGYKHPAAAPKPKRQQQAMARHPWVGQINGQVKEVRANKQSLPASLALALQPICVAVETEPVSNPGRTIETLAANQCKWPFGDGPITFDCDAPRASVMRKGLTRIMPYCAGHCAHAYAA